MPGNIIIAKTYENPAKLCSKVRCTSGVDIVHHYIVLFENSLSGKMKAKRSAKNDDRLIGTHGSSIQITNKLSLVQYKAWLVLLQNAYQEIPNHAVQKHKIPLSELSIYLGFPANGNAGHLREMLEGLVEAKVSWNMFSKDGSGEYGMAPMLAGLMVKNGVVEYDYSEFLREKFYNHKMFDILNLRILNLFSSKYSMIIYNICNDCIAASRTPVMELAEFRELMGLEKSEYPTFKSLNRRVIKGPVVEINRLSDISITTEYTKDKRKVTGIRFIIRKNPQLKLNIIELGNPGAFSCATVQDVSPPDKLFNMRREVPVNG